MSTICTVQTMKYECVLRFSILRPVKFLLVFILRCIYENLPNQRGVPLKNPSKFKYLLKINGWEVPLALGEVICGHASGQCQNLWVHVLRTRALSTSSLICVHFTFCIYELEKLACSHQLCHFSIAQVLAIFYCIREYIKKNLRKLHIIHSVNEMHWRKLKLWF